jgi:multidrug efflux pump subunit AcrA (membrane-fusion protein)
LRSKKFISIVVKIGLVIAVIAAVSGGCSGTVASVSVEQVGPRAIEETVMVAGTTQATNPTQVMPMVSGSVSQVFAQDGQEVAAGQPLIQLDTANLEQALLSAEASLESTQMLSGLFSSVSSTASSIGGAFNSIVAGVENSVTNLVDFEKSLVPALPENLRLQALQAIDSYQQRLANLKNNIPQISIGGGGGGGDAGAQQAAADKAIQNAENNLKGATITAPVAGTLVSSAGGSPSMESLLGTLMSSFSGMIPSGLNLSALTGVSGSLGSIGFPSGGAMVPGSFIMPGSPIFTIVDLKNMSLSAKVDESDIAKIQTGQDTTITLEAYPGKTFRGRVVKVSNTATTNEAGATAFEVTIQMDPSDINLKIGMSGTGDVTVAKKQATVVVPIDAIVEKSGKKYVFRVVDGKARLTPVTVGLTTDSDVEIIDGVNLGDTVVVRGVEKLKDGQSVKQ